MEKDTEKFLSELNLTENDKQILLSIGIYLNSKNGKEQNDLIKNYQETINNLKIMKTTREEKIISLKQEVNDYKIAFEDMDERIMKEREELMTILKSKGNNIKNLEEEKLNLIDEKNQLFEMLKKLKEENEILNSVILRAKKENTHLRKKVEELEAVKAKEILTDKNEDKKEKIDFNQKLKKSRELI